MKKYYLISAIVLVFTSVFTQAQTEKEAVVKVSGEVKTRLNIHDADLQKYKQTTVTRKDKDGSSHTYSGVLLSDILRQAGVTLGPELKGKNMVKYLLVEATDGYHVVFALPELDNAFTDRLIILADQIDGKPLSPADGPFRIIVQDEKKPARCVKQITSLKIVSAL